MVNPMESVPDADSDDPFSGDDATCDYCGKALNADCELLNLICLACLADEEREAKIRALDDLTAACRSVLSLAEIVGEDIRADYRCAWESTSHRLCAALRLARSL